MKRIFSRTLTIILSVVVLLAFVSCGKKGIVSQGDYKAIAYVTVPASENWRWIGEDGDEVVSHLDTGYVTHINFAFGMIEAYQFDESNPDRPLMNGMRVDKDAYLDPQDNQYHYKATVNGWIEEMKAKVDGSKYLHSLVKLKEQKPDLKVLLSIGGWDSDGFCFMAQTPEGRKEFIESCIALIDEYGLDGIDLDWEYPTNGGWSAIVSCPDCVDDARKLLVEFRAMLESKYPSSPKLLTIASGPSFVDEETFKALDYINVMCYDYDSSSKESQAPMFFVKERMQEHIDMVGDTPENRAKINLGVPFYNGGGPFLVPYHDDWTGGYVDASASRVKSKMDWVKKNGYGGGFYWAYSMDKFEQDTDEASEVKVLQRTLYETLNGK